MFLYESLLIQKLDTSSSLLLILLLFPNNFGNLLHFSTVNLPNDQVLRFSAERALRFILHDLLLFNCICTISHCHIKVNRGLNMLPRHFLDISLHQSCAFGSNACRFSSCRLWYDRLVSIIAEIRWYSIRSWTGDVTLCLVMQFNLPMALIKTE